MWALFSLLILSSLSLQRIHEPQGDTWAVPQYARRTTNVRQILLSNAGSTGVGKTYQVTVVGQFKLIKALAFARAATSASVRERKKPSA